LLGSAILYHVAVCGLDVILTIGAVRAKLRQATIAVREDNHVAGTLDFDAAPPAGPCVVKFSYGASGYTSVALCAAGNSCRCIVSVACSHAHPAAVSRTGLSTVLAVPSVADGAKRGFSVNLETGEARLPGSGPKLLVSELSITSCVLCFFLAFPSSLALSPL
jgi:hypothetical protein